MLVCSCVSVSDVSGLSWVRLEWVKGGSRGACPPGKIKNLVKANKQTNKHIHHTRRQLNKQSNKLTSDMYAKTTKQKNKHTNMKIVCGDDSINKQTNKYTTLATMTRQTNKQTTKEPSKQKNKQTNRYNIRDDD